MFSFRPEYGILIGMRLTFFRQRPHLAVMVCKAILLAVPFFVLLNLLNNHFFFTPSLRYSYRPGQKGNVIYLPTAASVIQTADKNLRWRLTTNSLPFTVTIPRLIDAIHLRLRLSPGTQPYVALVANGYKGSELSIIASSAVLDALDWKHVTTGNVTLWMRASHPPAVTPTTNTKNINQAPTLPAQPITQYSSVADFLAHPPADIRTVGTVGLDHMSVTHLPTYQPSASPITFAHAFRGSHKIYVYAAHETIRFALEKIDLNRQKGGDELVMRIARADQIRGTSHHWLQTVVIPDDGIIDVLGSHGKIQTATLTLPNDQPGAYIIDIATTNDVVFRNIVSNQHLLSFANRVSFADGPAYGQTNFSAIDLRATSSTLNFIANHDLGKQDILVNGKKVTVQDVKVNHQQTGLTSETAVTIPKGDLDIRGDGLIAIAPAFLIPDGAQAVDVTSSPNLNAIDYIVAEYVPQSTGRDVVEQTYTFSDLGLAGKNVTFSIEAPNMQATGATLGLDSIEATLIRGSFPWHKVWGKITGFFGLKQ